MTRLPDTYQAGMESAASRCDAEAARVLSHEEALVPVLLAMVVHDILHHLADELRTAAASTNEREASR